MRKYRIQTIAAMCCCALALLRPVYAVDAGRIVKSAAFPGMGQLGDDQVLKGLAFMGGEAVLLSLMFAEVSHQYSFAFDTKRLNVDYKMSYDYQELQTTLSTWQDSYDRAAASKNNALIWGGAAAAWWGLNIVDAILFPPRQSGNAESSLLRQVQEHTLLAVDCRRLELRFVTDF
jgi:hypothetical protein